MRWIFQVFEICKNQRKKTTYVYFRSNKGLLDSWRSKKIVKLIVHDNIDQYDFWWIKLKKKKKMSLRVVKICWNIFFFSDYDESRWVLSQLQTSGILLGSLVASFLNPNLPFSLPEPLQLPRDVVVFVGVGDQPGRPGDQLAAQVLVPGSPGLSGLKN